MTNILLMKNIKNRKTTKSLKRDIKETDENINYNDIKVFITKEIFPFLFFFGKKNSEKTLFNKFNFS